MASSLEIGGSDASYKLSDLPPKALQAVYHAATGKTESAERVIRKNVEIHNESIENLYHSIKQQLDVLQQVVNPTETIAVHYDDGGCHTYSSWERFEKIRQVEDKITSSMELKIECIITIPETGINQRLIISVGLDSSLPILCNEMKDASERIDFGWMAIARKNWRTVEIKIDYVDLIIAKNFIHTIEKWADALPPTTSADDATGILTKMPLISHFGPQVGRIGACTFLIFLPIFHQQMNLDNAITGIGIAGILWGMTEFLRKGAYSKLLEAAARSVVPSVILFNECDKRTYKKVNETKGPSAIRRLIGFCAWGVATVGANVFSSFVFAWWLKQI